MVPTSYPWYEKFNYVFLKQCLTGLAPGSRDLCHMHKTHAQNNPMFGLMFCRWPLKNVNNFLLFLIIVTLHVR